VGGDLATERDSRLKNRSSWKNANISLKRFAKKILWPKSRGCIFVDKRNNVESIVASKLDNAACNYCVAYQAYIPWCNLKDFGQNFKANTVWQNQTGSSFMEAFLQWTTTKNNRKAIHVAASVEGSVQPDGCSWGPGV
jgi:hypothetical protein